MRDAEQRRWQVCIDGFEPRLQAAREALTTLANGYIGVRGALSEACAGEIHYPGVYVAGVYDRIEHQLALGPLRLESLVNLPNPMAVRLSLPQVGLLCVESCDVLEHGLVLDMRLGTLRRHTRFRDTRGRITRLEEVRFVSVEERQRVHVLWAATAENWSGPFELTAGIDGAVRNSNARRFSMLSGRHIDIVDAGADGPQGLCLSALTRSSQILVTLAARHTLTLDGAFQRHSALESSGVWEHFEGALDAGQTVALDRALFIGTTHDVTSAEPSRLREALEMLPDFDAALHAHSGVWSARWCRTGLELRCEEQHSTLPSQEVLERRVRFQVFHLYQSVPPSEMTLNLGLPARGLHGEGYFGQIFWDELFAFRFLLFTAPEASRQLLLYRYSRIATARRAAQKAGLRGTLFPWRSAWTGTEATPEFQLNPLTNRFRPDYTYLQRHVNAAIAYDLWQYVQCTGEQSFMDAFGLELLVGISRLFASMASYDSASDRFDVRGVVGPDEFHHHYPGQDTPGVDNNAYTNVMMAWTLARTCEALARASRPSRASLLDRLAVSDEELEHWDRLSRRIRICFLDGGVIEQFRGYGSLKELDWEAYRARYDDLGRLDWILEAEGSSVLEYQVSKQPDAVMLFYLFSRIELERTFERLGYTFDQAVLQATADYYAERTSNGSTLSRVVDAWVAARLNRRGSGHLLERCLATDLEGTRASQGIHLGAMGGSLDLLLRGYGGLEFRDDALWVRPRLPAQLESFSLCVYYRQHPIRFRMDGSGVELTSLDSDAAEVRFGFEGQVYTLPGGGHRRFDR